MSVDQVSRLYPNGRLIKSTKQEVAQRESYWTASYEENGESYSVLLKFYQDRLSIVWVTAKTEHACQTIADDIENKFGKPFLDEKFASSWEKRWKSSTELIVA